MNKNSNIWAIIPARSGSKGIKNKNIIPFINLPLLVHSINFAKKLKFIDKIFLSTDSKKYKKIGEKNGADVPFLRSKKASMSYSMEEDVLEDIRLKLINNNQKLPEYILWLRPTHPLRDINIFKKGLKKLKKYKQSVCIVSEVDSRIFASKKNKLIALNPKFKNRSMVRRQDCLKTFKIFHGEFFKFPKKYDKKFLGKNIRYEVQNKLCDIDIDTVQDLNLYERIIQLDKKKYEKFLHTT